MWFHLFLRNGLTSVETAQFCSRVYDHAIRTGDIKCVKHRLRPNIIVKRTASISTLFGMYELSCGGSVGCGLVAHVPQVNSIQITPKDVFGGCQVARTIGRKRNAP